jgi:hypothetical protein
MLDPGAPLYPRRSGRCIEKRVARRRLIRNDDDGAIEGSLYGVAPADPVTYAGVALLLLAMAVVLVPLRRATGVDPAAD